MRQYIAINEGFRKTTGDIMAWLNSDDRYHSDAFLKVATAFRKQEGVEWLTGRATKWDAQGQVFHVDSDLPGWSREMLLSRGQTEFIQQESTFWKRSLWNKSGGFLRPDVSLAGDFELWVRFSRYASLYVVDAKLGGFRYHGNQRSVLQLDQYLQEVESLVEEELLLTQKGKYLSKPSIPLSIQISDEELSQTKKFLKHERKYK